jgi:predicted nucleotidyltransferase
MSEKAAKSLQDLASMPEPGAKVKELETRLKTDWLHLRKARQESTEKRDELRDALASLDSTDASIVVSGSMARGEFTSGSDIDWTLLIDGQADPTHHDLVREIRTKIQKLQPKQLGREGTFGEMVFSHGLIHEIGGEDDTNKNTTRRLLLLLESRAVGRQDAYVRVVRCILDRYLLEDRGLWKSPPYRVPRFLQNDFARYWRTMAVDFAYKVRKRGAEGWAIRNIKLRMSRKLIYASGLLACYRCHLDYETGEREAILSHPDRRKEFIEHLRGILLETPLDIVADMFLRNHHLDDAAKKVFGAYDEFIGTLSTTQSRTHLDELAEDVAEYDDQYMKMRTLSHDFRDGLENLFFDDKSELLKLTCSYGVF